MWELLLTVYLLSADGRATIDRRPPVPQASREACEESAKAAEGRQRADMRVLALCVRGGQP